MKIGVRSGIVCLLSLPFWLSGQVERGLGCNLLRSTELASKARAELAQERYAVAANMFRQAYESCPAQRRLLLEQAQALSSQRDFEGTIKTANEFLHEDPDSVEGRLVLANAYFMAQRFQECRQTAEQVLAKEPNNPAALKLKANTLYLIGDTSLAIDTFLELLEKHPEDEGGAYMLGRVYFQEGRIEHAIGQFQRVLRLNPKSHKAYDNLGLCYEASNKPELAIRYFLTAIKLVEEDHPDYDLAYANLANLLLGQEDNEKAFAAAAKAAKRNPYSARNFYLGGKALSKLGQAEFSLKWLSRSAELDPSYPEPLYLLGQAYTKLGEKEKAAEAFRKFKEAKAKRPASRR